jgi:cell division protein FtsB
MTGTRNFDDDRRQTQRGQRHTPASSNHTTGPNRRADSARDRYDRSSNRYASARNHERPAKQANVQQQARPANKNASKYSRDKYVRHQSQRKPMPVSQQNFAATKRVKPVNSTVLLVLGIIAFVLVAFIAIRFIGFSSTAKEYNTVQASISEQQSQLKTLDASNSDLQSQMDSMQSTIDKYKAM